MNMPRFTAQASLYQTSGHYQTGRYAVNLPTQTIGVIYPALPKDEVGEVIDVYGCNPGFFEVGSGANMTCVLDPSWAGGEGGPSGGEGESGGEGYGHGGGSSGGTGQAVKKIRPPKGSHKCFNKHSASEYTLDQLRRCTDAGIIGEYDTRLYCGPDKDRDGKFVVRCCKGNGTCSALNKRGGEMLDI